MVDKSLVKAGEQSHYLHERRAKEELGRRVHLVTSPQAHYLGTISVLEGYARAGEVLRGFYALLALWKSAEDLSGDQQLRVHTYGVSLRALEESGPRAGAADTNGAAGRFFGLQVGIAVLVVANHTGEQSGICLELMESQMKDQCSWPGNLALVCMIVCLLRISMDHRFTPPQCLFNRASLPVRSHCTSGCRQNARRRTARSMKTGGNVAQKQGGVVEGAGEGRQYSPENSSGALWML